LACERADGSGVAACPKVRFIGAGHAGTLASFSATVAAGAGDRDLAELARFVRERMLQSFE
jgi:hypothetical protein